MRITARGMARAAVAAVLGAVLGAAAAGAQEPTEDLFYEGEFELRPGGTLTAVLGDMDIDIETAAGSTGHVRVFARARDMAWAREVFDLTRFEATARGGDLEIRTREEEIDWRLWRERGWVSLRAEISVPSRYDVDVRSGDGDVRIGSLEGRLRVHAGDGDVAIGRVAGTSIELRAGDGDVTAEALEAEEIRLHAGDGDLVVRRASGRLTAESGDGDVMVEVVRFAGLSVRTGDGDVWLAVDPDVAADVDIEGEDVEVGRGLALRGNVRERRASGTLNGGGPRLLVRTGDGSITLRAR